MSAVAITIGTFDGVHLGHQELLRRCRTHVPREEGGKGGYARGRVVAFAFDPHPLSRIRPGTEPQRLTTFEQKATLLRDAGADEVVQLVPDDATLHESAEHFAQRVAREFAPTLVVVGPDFRFGAGRKGDAALLARVGEKLGFRVEVAPSVEAELDDQQVVRASSTLVRWLLAHGRVRDARRVLGRPYELRGVVSQGARVGRTLGVPTANLYPAMMLPMHGVYAGAALLPDGSRHTAAVHVGSRPTVQGIDARAEVHIMQHGVSTRGAWSPLAGVPEYGWPLRVELHAWVRDEMRFSSLEGLQGQIARDLARVRELMSAGGTVADARALASAVS